MKIDLLNELNYKDNLCPYNIHKMGYTAHTFKIEERRRQVASLLAQSMTQMEIASKLNVHQSTVSHDIAVLKEMSQRFVFDLAKSDLAFYYKQCIDGITEVKRKAWDLSDRLKDRDKIAALKLAKECDEARFSLFKEGPSIMTLKSFEERLSKIETFSQKN